MKIVPCVAAFMFKSKLWLKLDSICTKESILPVYNKHQGYEWTKPITSKGNQIQSQKRWQI